MNLSSEPIEKVLLLESPNLDQTNETKAFKYFDNKNNQVMGNMIRTVFSNIKIRVKEFSAKNPQFPCDIPENLKNDSNLDDNIEEYYEMETNLNKNKKLNSTLQDQETKDFSLSDEEDTSRSLSTSCENLKIELEKKHEDILNECGIGIGSKLLDRDDIETLKTGCNFINRVNFKDGDQNYSSNKVNI